jgi:glyoxylase-like metal-dependent hydrolase (beta-lactamase superfamily II)
MKVANGVEMLELAAALMSGPGNLYPTLLWDQEEAVLVDAGLPGMAREFIDAIEQTGVSPGKLGRVIITHHDLDHLGSLQDLQQMAPKPFAILAHADEVPYIQGERIPIKMTPKMMSKMESQMKGMPKEQLQEMRTMMESIGKQKIKVDIVLGDEEELPCCGGIQVIHTPGHTPGHISLYHKPSRTLIAGDLLFVEKGKLLPAPSFINADTSMAMASIQKLSAYDIANVIAYHGGLFRDSPNRRLEEIVRSS